MIAAPKLNLNNVVVNIVAASESRQSLEFNEVHYADTITPRCNPLCVLMSSIRQQLDLYMFGAYSILVEC